MTADRPTTTSRWSRLLAAIALVLLPAMLVAPPATASTDEPPCEPDNETACIAVLVLNADNDRISDVAITVAGAGFTADLTTNADGPATVAAPEVGQYTVTIDPATLPDDQQLPEGAETEVTVTAQSGGTARAAFRVGPGAEAPATPSGEASDGAPADSTTTDDGDGVAAAPEGDASERALTFAQVWQQIGSGLRFGLLLALASIGLNLVFGTTGLSNFAHGEQFALGAAVGFITINQMGMSIWVGGLLTLAVCALTGLAQDSAIWRPLRKRNVPVMQLMIVSIGLSITLQYVIQLMIGGGSERILSRNPQPLTIAGITLSTASWLSMVVALVCVLGIAWFLTRTRIGRATRAVSDNPALASATGIDPDRIIRIVWIMATGFAALAGLMWGVSFGSFNWQLGVQLLLLMFAAVTLGGLGTALGAFVGSLLIGQVVELSNLFIPSDLRYASALVILILVLLFRPQGILGRRERIG
ncbi:amino acid/amide ABC transporter membrane protein 1 (HAAT family) [Isoptericola sp. CG 20/1183]|uniref:Amino acid/amide ABC transporter membrane protein 1 (HAAT family) n=1 Tax=Isoptericola halotolerans TaxID=300560 RepID=A0ABX5EH23_9MICO|nr:MULTISPECIES: branched-chain amino acid ABC transporter permease [Isoptericola]PRZ08625.1 amino acid/amide ABC transporter membrane protein 1 (HAAT family) [Isoptericola halotolerans]PRZ10928.1 amino acid/amide ABC transporter membrane protein 1 (HAAT family) [Isoptericola sp. CG 20/1183]